MIIVEQDEEDQQHSRGQTDRVDGHDRPEGLTLRKDESDPSDPDAADTEGRQQRGRQRDPKAPEVAAHDLMAFLRCVHE